MAGKGWEDARPRLARALPCPQASGACAAAPYRRAARPSSRRYPALRAAYSSLGEFPLRRDGEGGGSPRAYLSRVVMGIETSCDERPSVSWPTCGACWPTSSPRAAIHARYGASSPNRLASPHRGDAGVVKAARQRRSSSRPTSSRRRTAAGLAGIVHVGLTSARPWPTLVQAAERRQPLEGPIYANWLGSSHALYRRARSFGAATRVAGRGTRQLSPPRPHARDAAGEPFDKPSRVSPGFPGVPAIEKASRDAGPKRRAARPGWRQHDCSFSGLKTAVGRVAAESGLPWRHRAGFQNSGTC